MSVAFGDPRKEADRPGSTMTRVGLLLLGRVFRNRQLSNLPPHRSPDLGRRTEMNAVVDPTVGDLLYKVLYLHPRSLCPVRARACRGQNCPVADLRFQHGADRTGHDAVCAGIFWMHRRVDKRSP